MDLANLKVKFQGEDTTVGKLLGEDVQLPSLFAESDISALQVLLDRDNKLELGVKCKNLSVYVPRIYKAYRNWSKLGYCMRTDVISVVYANRVEALKKCFHVDYEHFNIYPEPHFHHNDCTFFVITEDQEKYTEYEEICQTFPDLKIYLLQENFGRASLLRTYNDPPFHCSYGSRIGEYSEQEMVKFCLNNKFFILTGESDIGKTTSLHFLSNNIKHARPELWVQVLNLGEMADNFCKMLNFCSPESALYFIATKLLKLHPIQTKLFEYLCRAGRVILLFDEIDELLASATKNGTFDNVLSKFNIFVAALLQSNVRHVMLAVTPQTKPLIKYNDEDILKFEHFEFKDFNEDNQETFFFKFWLQILTNKSEVNDLQKENLTNFVKQFMCAQRSTTYFSQFPTSPTHCFLLANIFSDQMLEYIQNSNANINLEFDVNISSNIEQFISKKLIALLEKLLNISKENASSEMMQPVREKQLTFYEHLAMTKLFPELKNELNKCISDSELQKNVVHMQDTGIVQNGEFINNNFIFYFSASFMAKQVKTEMNFEHLNAKFSQMLKNPLFRLARKFLNEMLCHVENVSPFNENFKTEFDYCYKNGQNLFHVAIAEQHEHIALLFIKRLGNSKILIDLLNAVDENNCTPLLYAVKQNYCDLIAIMLKHGVDITPMFDGHNNILHIAATTGNCKIVELLLSKRSDVDVNATNEHGDTPVSVAFENYNVECAKLLVAKCGLVEEDIISAGVMIHTAISSNDLDVVKWLFQIYNTDIFRFPDTKRGNESVLIKASRIGNLKIFEFLFENGVDVLKKEENSSALSSSRNNIPIMKFLLEHGANPNDSVHSWGVGVPFIQYFSKIGNIDAVQLLVQHGVDCKVTDDYGDTPVHVAIKSFVPSFQILEILKLLQQGGVVLDKQNNSGDTPLHVAARKGKAEIVKFLLEHKVDISLRNGSGYHAIHEAAKSGMLHVLKLLAFKNWTDINSTVSKDGLSLLHLAAISFKLEVVEWLAKTGRINLDLTDNRGETALHYSCTTSKVSITQFLIENGANINAKNKYGETPLHLAVSSSSVDVVKFLLQNGADMSAKDSNGRTPLLLCIEKSAPQENGEIKSIIDISITECLINFGCETDSIQNDFAKNYIREICDTNLDMLVLMTKINLFPLLATEINSQHFIHKAVRSRNNEYVKMFLEKGGDVNYVDSEGRSPLHVAVGRYSCFDVEGESRRTKDSSSVKLLLEHGADVHIKDIKGDTPLHVAARNYLGISQNMLPLLIEKGADVSVKNNELRTPSMVAKLAQMWYNASYLDTVAKNVGKLNKKMKMK